MLVQIINFEIIILDLFFPKLNMGPNPNQICNTDTALPKGHVLHPLVGEGGMFWGLLKVREVCSLTLDLHCPYFCTDWLVRTPPRDDLSNCCQQIFPSITSPPLIIQVNALSAVTLQFHNLPSFDPDCTFPNTHTCNQGKVAYTGMPW